MQNSQTVNSGKSLHKKSTPDSSLIEISREFDVPVEKLFAAFESADAIKAWWWPEGLHSDHADYDFSVGARYFINMKGQGHNGDGMTGKFEEIVENKLIVMSDHFADRNGRSISAKEAKMPGKWPAVVYINFEFDGSGDSTRLNFSQQGIPNEMQDDCRKGWNEMFDKLEAYISRGRQ